MKSSAPVAHEFAVDRLDVGKDAIHRRADLEAVCIRVSAFFTASRNEARLRSRSICLGFERMRAGVSLRSSLFRIRPPGRCSAKSIFQGARHCASAILSGSEDGNSSRALFFRRLQIGLRLLELTSGRFIGNRGEEFVLRDRFPNRTATGRNRIGEPNEAVILRPHMNHERPARSAPCRKQLKWRSPSRLALPPPPAE